VGVSPASTMLHQMVCPFDEAGVQIQIYDTVISCCIPQKNSFEVMFVKFALTIPEAFDAHTGTKKFEVTDVWPKSEVPFVWGVLHNGVHQAVMQVY
jgi:hypothetical protein